ncbi:hypothetical protein HN51_061871 [Arachis hypogaea]|uniref:CTLH domain-containing protein n=3 Tax=Arachis TaxID=3817 RepID=A0A445AQ36_ARAHY|nr:uncharacterized protein LOC112720452 [Arachis hypogaea]QHO19234.1 uncharacterized protein DS421_11g327120 [Arachis hypogaea]RYR28556.1 hypothetical protein Ahy_B01g052701 [Arachis hypogaea]
MESTPVNWEALDALVIEFAKLENLIEDATATASAAATTATTSASSPSSSPSPSPSSSSYQSRLVILQIRRYLESGVVDAAVDLLRLHAPSILNDHRILFRLHKQKFIELLRKGTMEDRDSAIECLRAALAPCALDAYPEAYEEFKHVLLAFIYDKDDKSSPVANEWSERRRLDLAGFMSSMLRAHLNAYDPVFSLALRYLISIHRAYCLRQGITSPISDLTERLLLEERDHPAIPQDILYEVPPFDEVDIQALAHAVELTRQGAIDSLRFAKGDLFLAFQNELCRIKLDTPYLDQLVREYCVYRGIIESVSEKQPIPEPVKFSQQDPVCFSSRDCSLELDCNVGKHSDGETSVTNVRVDGSPENNADVSSMQGMDVEVRYASELTNSHEDCSTSGSQLLENPSILQRRRMPGNGERSKRKRWRGRYDYNNYVANASLEDSKQENSISTAVSTVTKEKQGCEKLSINDASNTEDKYEILLGMKDLASNGMAAEAVEEVNAIDPNFFSQNCVLLFQLKQVEFLKLVSSGDYNAALKVACSHLGPLAASDPTLLKPLKETLLALLRPSEDALGSALPLNALAASLQVAVGRRLGVEEPQLMKIMRATLHTHNEWFKLQMCKDRFEGLLRINSLKEVHAPFLTSMCTSKSHTDSCTNGSSQATVSSGTRPSEDGSSPTQDSSRDAICDEGAILKVMEFLALPRADAIHLLAQYNGNAETVIQQLFA